MYYLKSEAAFDSAHFLKGYKGKCSNIHGHRWRVVATIYSENLNSDVQTSGMVMDFKTLKSHLRELCEYLDHAFICERASMQEKTYEAFKNEGFRIVEIDKRPTAENLAKYIFDILKEKGLPMKTVEVYETPTNCAIYEE